MTRVFRQHPVASTIATLTLCVMLGPFLIVLGVSVNPGAQQMFPPAGFSFHWYLEAVRRSEFQDSFLLSVALAAGATIVAIFIGMLGALALSRYEFRGRRFLELFLLSPLFVPQVVIGISFLILMVNLGLLDSILSLVILHVILTLPFAVRLITAALSKADAAVELAARSLGADPIKAFFLVTLPMIKPGIAAAAVFTFVTSFENFTATQFVIWKRTTLPVEIYNYIQTENDPTIAAISTILMVLVALLVVAVNRYAGLNMITNRGR